MRLNDLAEASLDKKTLSIKELAKKHGVSVEKINTELKIGIQVEQEHTSSLTTAKEIALDHLKERPDYYTVLKRAKL